jgi:hypothetical protein
MDHGTDGPGWLDEQFPLGEGTADTEAGAYCPYCGEWVEIAVDPGGGAHQEYVEDCEVCCQSWRVRLYYDDEGVAHVALHSLDE